MAKSPYGRGNIGAARDFLAGIPEFTAHSQKGAAGISEGQATRLANAFARQLGTGVTPNYQAARGHAFTPEHPTSAPPRLPEPAQRYSPRPQQSKYARARIAGESPEPGPSGGAGRERRVTGEPSPAPEIQHNRQRGRSHIAYQDTGEIYTRNTEREARGILAYAETLDVPGNARIVVQVFDCTHAGRSGNAGWFPMLSHTWGAGGIDIDSFMELWRAHGGTLERFIMDTINGNSGLGDSDRSRHGPITHICQYEITILPYTRVIHPLVSR